MVVPAAGPARRPLTLGVPAYFYPWPGDRWWVELAEAPRGSLVVLTPDNGPGRAPDDHYLAVLEPLRSRGHLLYGYVDSAYAARKPEDLLREVASWTEWYGVHGIFVDQVEATPDNRPEYARLCEELRRRGLRIAFNPGQPQIDPSYLLLADHVLVFEGTLDTYRAQVFPPWLGTVDPDLVWHCVYGVDDESQLSDVLDRAEATNAGIAFVTDGRMPNPWDRLPGYWPALVAACAVTAPNG